ncbi:MAG: delta-aminolevulinic acid dehydratase, partial [Bacteroidales bacterium]
MFNTSFINLKSYCESQNFAGWDPYDGLNSKVFRFTPLKHWDLARLFWIQAFKRNPVNLRKIFFVPKEHNAKGIGLFLTGYCNLYKAQQQTGRAGTDEQAEVLKKIDYLAQLLISMQSKGYAGACWGYNFDWQALRLFLFPKNTPTVVATTFGATALFEAYEITKNKTYLETALSSANFVLNNLKRTPKNEGFLFSYSPLEGNNTVYNASLLGSKLLSYAYRYSGDEKVKAAARESVVACVNAQRPDGSWLYGELPVQNWIDSFHTGYNLDALMCYQENTGDKSFAGNIEKGFEFYIKSFFLEDGTPKYYHNRVYPIDIHCPAQL